MSKTDKKILAFFKTVNDLKCSFFSDEMDSLIYLIRYTKKNTNLDSPRFHHVVAGMVGRKDGDDVPASQLMLVAWDFDERRSLQQRQMK